MSDKHLPASRRQARQLRDAHPAADTDLLAAIPSPPRSRRPRGRRRSLWVWLSVATALIALVIAGGVVAKHLYDQAVGVRSHLEHAMQDVKDVQRAVLGGDLDAASAASDRLSVNTDVAVSGTAGRIWSAAEHLPFVGDNLAAVRLVAEVTDRLATDVVSPVSKLSLDAFRPQNGQINLEAVSSLTPLIDQIDGGLKDALDTLATVNQSNLINQVADGVQRLNDSLAEVQPLIQPMRDIVAVLPNALGANGPRNYLLMFQGNSEARSLGGNAAVFTLVRAEGGRLEVVDQANSSDFLQARPQPVAPLDPEAVAIFGDKIGRFTPDFTMVPDFPDAVGILNGWWSQFKSSEFDSVISIDPVALSYILSATGPIVVPTGEQLDAGNAASLLLNEVYFRYEEPKMQNEFFGAAADAIFNTLTGGNFDPKVLVPALDRAGAEGRLMYLSSDPIETELLAGTRIAGVMPTEDTQQPFLGVYINDNTGSKKTYYLDANIKTCRSGSDLIGEVTLTSRLTAAEAARLPYQVTGPYFDPSDISTYVALYGPIGSDISAVAIDGQPANVASAGHHLGRPVVKVEILNHLESTHTLSFTYSDVTVTGPLKVWNTPLTRDTAVEITESCG